MKLEKILDQLNSFEKNSFLKVITNIIDDVPKNSKEIESILVNYDKDLKNVENINIAKVLGLIEDEYAKYIRSELAEATSQLDILIDILIRDGNCIMSREWFNKLYENEIKTLEIKLKEFEKEIQAEKSEISERRKRDYKIYRECLKTAYYNDELRNQDCKVTSDEQSVLVVLSKNLGLSQEEIKLINYLIIKIKKEKIDNVINELKNLGIIFYSKKTLKIYIADEIVRILRKVRGKEVADKYYRRVLKNLRGPQINMIAKNPHINWGDKNDIKIKKIIKEGIIFSDVLTDDIFKEETKVSEKKSYINEFIEKQLNIKNLRGATLEEKIDNLIDYFDTIDKDEKVGISIDGYEKLLSDLDRILPNVKINIKEEFELQEENIFKSDFLLDYNIKPRDILDLLSESSLKSFCEKMDIKSRGNLVTNVLDKYKDAENLYIENYRLIAYRDINKLKENGLIIKDIDIGIKFEEITKKIFQKLGFSVDEKIRKELNNAKNKIDIIINL